MDSFAEARPSGEDGGRAGRECGRSCE